MIKIFKDCYIFVSVLFLIVYFVKYFEVIVLILGLYKDLKF